jgi:GNAT superfamily N-acetyltransferase
LTEDFSIRRYTKEDEDELLAAYATVVVEGGAFPRRPPADLEMLHSAWLRGATTVQVARLGDTFAGAYFVRPAFPGLAAHIANAGYLVVKELRGRGIGSALAMHSLDEAKRRDYDAMLFSLVLERNPSRRLWLRLGFREIGRIPGAIDGEDAFMYWRAL